MRVPKPYRARRSTSWSGEPQIIQAPAVPHVILFAIFLVLGLLATCVFM